MNRRCPDAVAIEPMYLPDYRLAFSGVATIQPSQGNFVPGALWAITERCEASLDIFEGYPSMYRKETIMVDGMEIMFYAMNSNDPYEPNVNYLMTIAEGYQDWQLELDDLFDAVRITQQESYRHDLQRSTSSTRNTGQYHGLLESSLYLESSDGLCDLRDDGHARQHLRSI